MLQLGRFEESSIDKGINILFPVRNEHRRLLPGISKTISILDDIIPDSYYLTIIDNGSDDDTPEISRNLCKDYPHVRYCRIDNVGVGAAFRMGVFKNDCRIVGYMDVDLATNPRYVAEVLSIFSSDPSAEIVNGSRWACAGNSEGRPIIRRITSAGLTSLLHVMFGMKATDAICGFKFFKREIAEALIEAAGESSDSWAYIVDLLIRAERAGVRIVELPVEWRDDGQSSVKVVSQTIDYAIELSKLKRRLDYGR